MPNNEDESSRAQVRKRLGIPDSYVPLTSEEFILQQQYIRDVSNRKVVEILSVKEFKARGVLALQELGLRAQHAIYEEYSSRAPGAGSDPVVIGYEYKLPNTASESRAEA